jgi:hypothetical protein
MKGLDLQKGSQEVKKSGRAEKTRIFSNTDTFPLPLFLASALPGFAKSRLQATRWSVQLVSFRLRGAA